MNHLITRIHRLVQKCLLLLKYVLANPFFNPNKIGFTIFWIPIVLPLSISVLSVLGDMRTDVMENNSVLFHFSDFKKLLISLFKNSNLSFLSTDIWALSTIFSYATYVHTRRNRQEKTHPRILEGVNAGTLIGLFYHLIAFVFLSVLPNQIETLILAVILSIFGFIGVVMIRGAVYQWIERVNPND